MRRGFLGAQRGGGVNGRRRVMRSEPLPALLGLFVTDRVKRAVVAGVVAGAGVAPKDELHGGLLADSRGIAASGLMIVAVRQPCADGHCIAILTKFCTWRAAEDCTEL